MRRHAEMLRFLASDPVPGAPIGATPHVILSRQGATCLRWYQPAAVQHAAVFVCMPLINTAAIWDLLPGRSVVGSLLRGGFPVAVLDWGRPGPELAERPLGWFVDEVIGRAVDRARRHASVAVGSDALDGVGYCVGGTFLGMHLARHDGALRSFAAVAAPFDFAAGGRLATWTAADFPTERMAGPWGNFPASRMRDSFVWLRPEGAIRKWTGLLDGIDDPDFRALWVALERWNADAVDFPGEAWVRYVRGLYQDNALMDGTLVVDGTACDLACATVPALALAAAQDHIAPPAAVHGLARRWSGPVTQRTICGGHVGISVGQALPDALVSWLAEQGDERLA